MVFETTTPYNAAPATIDCEWLIQRTNRVWLWTAIFAFNFQMFCCQWEEWDLFFSQKNLPVKTRQKIGRFCPLCSSASRCLKRLHHTTLHRPQSTVSDSLSGRREFEFGPRYLPCIQSRRNRQSANKYQLFCFQYFIIISTTRKLIHSIFNSFL